MRTFVPDESSLIELPWPHLGLRYRHLAGIQSFTVKSTSIRIRCLFHQFHFLQFCVSQQILIIFDAAVFSRLRFGITVLNLAHLFSFAWAVHCWWARMDSKFNFYLLYRTQLFKYNLSPKTCHVKTFVRKTFNV